MEMNLCRAPRLLLTLAVLFVVIFSCCCRTAYSQGFAIVVQNPDNADREGVCVTPIGVPAALNARDVAGLCLVDDSLAPVPVQFRVLSRWGGTRDTTGNPIRWLQVAFPVSLPPSAARTYYVVYDAPVSGELVVTGSDPVQVATGVANITIPARALPLSSRIEMVDAAGAPVTYAVTSTVVEVSGSVLACVKQTGTMSNGLRFTLRWYFETRSTCVRVDFRLENPKSNGFPWPTTDPLGVGTTYFRSLALVVPITEGKPYARRIGTPAEGDTLSYSGALGVAVDRAGENWPKGLLITENDAFIELWPAGGSGPLFWGQYPDPARYPQGIDPTARTAYRFEGGRWKTHTVVVDLNGRAPATKPLIGSAAPWWTVDSGALGVLLSAAAPPPTTPVLDRWERICRVLVDDTAATDQPTLGRVGLPQFRRNKGTFGQHPTMYGWENYGDITWGGGYSSLHYALDWCALSGFWRTGDYRFYDVGRDLATHRRDYDQLHTVQHERRGGAAYETGATHGNYDRPLPSHTWIQGIATHYLITGDEASREALQEALGFFSRQRPDLWDGWWGSRILALQLEGLMHIWNTLGDPAALTLAAATARRWVALEKGNGCVYNLGSANMIPGSPIHEQTWMHCMVLRALGIYWLATQDPQVVACIGRMAEWIEKRMLRSDLKCWDRARGTLVDAADDWHSDVNAHHAFYAADGLSYASVVTGNRHFFDVAYAVWENAVKFPLGGRNPPAYDPIAFYTPQFPNAETKVNGGAVWCGMSVLGAQRIFQ